MVPVSQVKSMVAVRLPGGCVTASVGESVTTGFAVAPGDCKPDPTGSDDDGFGLPTATLGRGDGV